MLQLLPEGLPTDSQDLGRATPPSLGQFEDGEDMVPFRIFPDLSERLLLP
jgi:hypothetical protein